MKRIISLSLLLGLVCANLSVHAESKVTKTLEEKIAKPAVIALARGLKASLGYAAKAGQQMSKGISYSFTNYPSLSALTLFGISATSLYQASQYKTAQEKPQSNFFKSLSFYSGLTGMLLMTKVAYCASK